ncbi:MAG: sodium:proton antiporter [bacterium]
MKLLMTYTIGVLIFAGLYLILSSKFWKVILGTVFLSHSVNLTLLASGGHFPGKDGNLNPPVFSEAARNFMDPLPQALVLTAIVISFGVTAFALVVLRQVFKKTGTTNLKQIEQYEWRTESKADE